jgi:hypothetical protein
MRFWRPPLYHSSYWPVSKASTWRLCSSRFLMWRMSAAVVAKLFKLQPLRRGFLILCRRIVAVFAFRTFKSNNISHGRPPYSIMSEIVPAPTVRPPSRIAKRKPFSIAIGVINLMVRFTLSPGITISVPSGNSATPVTSVVRK